MREYLELQLPVKAMGDLLYRSRIFSYLAAATPGLREMVTVGKIWELALKQRKTRGGKPYDLVIVDAPATGHGIGLLQTPQDLRRDRPRGPMAHQASTINRTLTNHEQAGAVIVALPEEMPVNESATLEARADRFGRHRRRPDLHERPLPGALQRRGAEDPGKRARGTPSGSVGRGRCRGGARRGAGGQAPTASSSSACAS